MIKTTRANFGAARARAVRRTRMCRVGTYLEEPSLAADLAADRKARLLFAGRLSHGVEQAALMEYYIAGSHCGRFDVLWLKSDWCEGLSARAWSPRGGLPGKKLWEALLMAYWTAERATQEFENPPFNEIASDSGVMQPERIWEIVERVWPQIE